MAKDVDLSSHKWRELIFEGKNKEFGAYQLRKDSNRRHGLAMIIVSAVLAVILTIVILIFSGVIGGDDEVDPNAGVDQALVNLATEEEAPEEEQQMEEIIEEPEPEPEPEVEEVAETKMTELVIEDDKNVKQENQVREVDLTDDTSVGTQNVESDKKDIKEDDINAVTAQSAAPKEEPKPEAKPEPKPEPPKPDPEENKVFTTVEQKAMYPGGDAALLAWINSNIQYPPMAVEDDAQGRVMVSFVVEKDGSITAVKVERGRHPELDKEALRVVRKIPKKFTPAKQNGKNVRYKFNLPVTFKLQK